MLKEMRRRDRELSESEARKILLNGEYGVLSTIGTEYPYSVPINYVVIDNYIYIHGSCEEGQKIINIKKNNNVCFTVVGKTKVLPSKFSEKYESVIVLGKAKIVNDDMKEKALEAFLDKYSPEFKESGMKYIDSAKEKTSVYSISIEQITGKAHR